MARSANYGTVANYESEDGASADYRVLERNCVREKLVTRSRASFARRFVRGERGEEQNAYERGINDN